MDAHVCPRRTFSFAPSFFFSVSTQPQTHIIAIKCANLLQHFRINFQPQYSEFVQGLPVLPAFEWKRSLISRVKLYDPKLSVSLVSLSIPAFIPPLLLFSPPLLSLFFPAIQANLYYWYSMFFVCMFRYLRDRKDIKEPWDPKCVYGVCVGVIIFVSALFLA